MGRPSLGRILALVVIVGFVSHTARAQDPAAFCSCNAKAGTVVIRYSPDLDEDKTQRPGSPPPVRFFSLLDLDKAHENVEGTRSKTISCQLKADRFEIRLEPGVPNPSLLGRCGADVTGVVTVKRNGTVVLKEQEFEDMNCHERKRMLLRITFKDGSSKPVLVYVRYPEE